LKFVNILEPLTNSETKAKNKRLDREAEREKKAKEDNPEGLNAVQLAERDFLRATGRGRFRTRDLTLDPVTGLDRQGNPPVSPPDMKGHWFDRELEKFDRELEKERAIRRGEA